MALARYHRRAAVAAAQIIEGFDESAFEEKLSGSVGLSFGEDVLESPEGLALLDLAVRLLARLYPTLALIGPASAALDGLKALATAINPLIELTAKAQLGIVVGSQAPSFERAIYAGCDGWNALVSTEEHQPIGNSLIPFGAGASACLAAANLFRAVIFGYNDGRLDQTVCYSTYALDRVETDQPSPALPPQVELPLTGLVGAGAVGNGFVWALARARVEGTLHVVDPEPIELSNLQRYVLAVEVDEHLEKVELARRALEHLEVISHDEPFAKFAQEKSELFHYGIVCVDNAHDRVALQASLPRVALNAWTQPGDIGVSVHPQFGETGACVACLYLDARGVLNEDDLVAEALGVPERSREVRTLLATGAPPPPHLLTAIAASLNVEEEALEPFATQPIRTFYAALCGGAVVPLDRLGRADGRMHVPLAHQSALAGVLLAASFVRHAAGHGPDDTRVSRVDILQPVGVLLTQPRGRTEHPRCICSDPIFVQAYRSKWTAATA